MNNKRLLAIANIFEQSSVIDVGSDHGYLPIYLLTNKKVTSSIIIEVNDGPLKNATTNVRKRGLTNKVEFLKSNGLSELTMPIKSDTGVVIAGMGGSLIQKIIDQDFKKFQCLEMYLQPNNNEYELRNYLMKNKFKIEKDFLIEEDEIIYTIIKCSFTDQLIHYSEKELLFGIDFKKDSLFIKKWSEEKEHLLKIQEKLSTTGHCNSLIDKKIEQIKDVLGE